MAVTGFGVLGCHVHSRRGHRSELGKCICAPDSQAVLANDHLGSEKSRFIISLSHRNVLSVGRHSLATKRRKSSAVLAAVIAPAAVLFAVGADVDRFPTRDAKPVAEVASCCLEIVAAAPDMSRGALGLGFTNGQFVRASRWHARSRLLLPGVAPEQGLQVRTILAARSISAAFPEIR